MAEKSALELLEAAERYRVLAGTGGDPTLLAALLTVAEEFTREAAEVEARSVDC